MRTGVDAAVGGRPRGKQVQRVIALAPVERRDDRRYGGGLDVPGPFVLGEAGPERPARPNSRATASPYHESGVRLVVDDLLSRRRSSKSLMFIAMCQAD